MSQPAPLLRSPVDERLLPPPVFKTTARPDRGFWAFWLAMSVDPRLKQQYATAVERERYRRSRLLSALQLAAFILVVALVPRGLLPTFDPGTIIGIIAFTVIVIGSMILNRTGRVSTASFIYVFGLAIAIAGSQLFTPTGKIAFSDLAGYDLLVIPIIITSILLPRRVLIGVWLFSVLFPVIDLALAEHGPSLEAFLPHDIPAPVNIYPVAIYPVILMSIVVVVSWLVAGSIERALREEDRTADLEAAYELLAQQKEELEQAIAAIQQVHNRFASGDFTARASTASDNILQTLSISLNLMLERLSHSTQTQANLYNLEQQIALLAQYIAQMSQGYIAVPIDAQQLGQLSSIAQNLEQLRQGLIAVTNYSFDTVNRVYNDARSAKIDVTAVTRDRAAVDRLSTLVDRIEQNAATLINYLGRFRQ